MVRCFLLTTLLTLAGMVHSQPIPSTTTNAVVYRAQLLRADGNHIVFQFLLNKTGRQPTITIINDRERMRVDSVRFSTDSVFVQMPFFESQLRAAVTDSGWQGVWMKATSKGQQTMPFMAAADSLRFWPVDGNPAHQLGGRWEVHFASDSISGVNAIGEFKQHGRQLTGSFVTTTGDYRYLDGIVTGKSLQLSTFDGSHAYLFTADIASDSQIVNGRFYAGPTYVDEWKASKKPGATIPADASAMYLKPGESTLNFTFPDLDSNLVSIRDERFKNKVVIVQLMGSWCPNCMDETAFLSPYYKANRQRGVEVVALAYEYTADYARAQKNLGAFKKRFNVTYPILFTGVSTTDPQRTEKTLPQLTPIKVFPSAIILDKAGKVRKLDNGFAGPGTGVHYQRFIKEFTALVDKLLAE